MTSDVMLTGTIATPHLWSGRPDPYLYSAYVQVGHDGTVAYAPTDDVSQPVAFRSFAVDPATGFSLNGQSYDLHGVNRHQDRLDMGWAITDREHDQDMALIAEMGVTAIRLAHYQHAQHFYDLCDRQGMVVWAEFPLVNSITVSQAFTDNAHQQLTELIRQSYNHPAIVFWSIGNEQRNDDVPTNTLLGGRHRRPEPSVDVRALLHQRYRRAAVAHRRRRLQRILRLVRRHLRPVRRLGRRRARRAPHGADRRQRVRRRRRAVAARRQPHDAGRRRSIPPRGIPGVAARSDLETDRGAAVPVGQFVWNMFDFAVDDRNEGDTPGRNDKGMVSDDRLTKKDAFFWYKANWSSEPFVYITGRRFNPRTTATIDIKVYSNLHSVTLTVGGVALPAQTSTDHIFIRPAVPLNDGDNLVDAQASSSAAAATATDGVTWTRQ